MDVRDDGQLPADVPASSPDPVPFPKASGRDKPTPLAAALRRARVENAERTDVVTDLRDAEMTRLEILREHLQPVFDEVPADCDIFDPGIAPGAKPRLFVDMVAFVEMGRDRRTYRFLQDTRGGRVVLTEAERMETIVRAVTDYLARRLIEREKALATLVPAATLRAKSAEVPAAMPGSPARRPQPPRERPTPARVMARSFLFLVEIIGSAVLFGALATGALWLWQTYGK